MDYLTAVVLGVIQGLTEWLPISSSGHLALLQHFFGVRPPVVFDILLHVGTLGAVLAFFRKDLFSIVRDVLSFDERSEGCKVFLLIIIASVPTAIIGLFLEDFFESMFTNITLVGIALVITGLIIHLTKGKEGKKDPDWKNALVMGLFQGFAVAPGISRSGMTISSGILMGVGREKAARLSFLLFIPAISGALILKSQDIASMDDSLVGPAVVGMVISGIVGYVAIGALLRILKNEKFHDFSYYCLLLGLISIILSFT